MGHLSPTPVPGQGLGNTEEKGLERMQKPGGRKECGEMLSSGHGHAITQMNSQQPMLPGQDQH